MIILNSCIKDQIQIICRRIVVFIRKSMRIYKMRLGCTQRSCFLIHKFSKFFYTA